MQIDILILSKYIWKCHISSEKKIHPLKKWQAHTYYDDYSVIYLGREFHIVYGQSMLQIYIHLAWMVNS